MATAAIIIYASYYFIFYLVPFPLFYYSIVIKKIFHLSCFAFKKNIEYEYINIKSINGIQKRK